MKSYQRLKQFNAYGAMQYKYHRIALKPLYMTVHQRITQPFFYELILTVENDAQIE